MRDKSDENWRVGNKCLEDGDLNVAASRIYYATFQSVLDWARKTKGYTKEVGAHQDMCQYVKAEGKQGSYFGRKFREMRTLRETADYQTDPPDKDDLENLLTDCTKIRNYYFGLADAK